MSENFMDIAFREQSGSPITRRILLIGEDNPVSSRLEHALYQEPAGCAGHRLMRIMAIEEDDYLGLWRANLCSPTWDSKEALRRSCHLLVESAPWTKVILLGAKVAGIHGMNKVTEFGRVRKDFGNRTFEFLKLPHPSGRSFAWNDPSSKDRARDALHGLEPSLPWGITL